MTIPTINHRALPIPASEDGRINELRYRAEVDRSFSLTDRIFGQVNNRLDILESVGATVYYTVTDDAGDGTLAGDANATDYTGQTGNVNGCADIVAGPVYYFTHKDQLYIYTGVRPRRFGANCPDTVVDGDFTPFGGLIDWDDIQNKPDFDGIYLRLDTTNDPLTNPLTLSGKPTQDLHATTKNYVGVSNYDTTVSYQFDEFVAYEGALYHCITVGGTVPGAFNIADWNPVGAVTSTGISLSYRWSTVTAGDPGAGRFGITAPMANPTNVVRVSELTNNNINVAQFWDTIDAGDYIIFVEETGGAESGIWIATGPAVDLGTYREISVNWVANTGEPENNRLGTVSIVYDPNRLLIPGGLTNQYLRKTSDFNYEVEWATLVEAGITDLDRVRWRAKWIQQQYEKNDMVIGDGAWLMIANKQTSDVAPPRPDGNPVWTAPDVPTWDTPNPAFSGVVESGMEYATTVPIELTGYQIWVPALTANTNYVIRTYAYPTDDPSQIVFEEIGEPLLIENEWTTVAVSRQIVNAGTTFGVLINALNSGSNTTVGPFDWVREANSNTVAPATGNWNRNNSGTLLRINKTDNDAQDRTGDLTGVIAGSTVTIVQKDDATRSVTYRTTTGEADGGAHFEWGIELSDTGVGGEPAVGVATVITITVPLPNPTEYVQWTGGVTAVGFPQKGRLTLGGVEQPAQDDNLFGVRVLAEVYVVSPDWDVAGYVALGGGGSGGGGGGGATTFPQLTDTPASYAGAAGQVVAVTAGEDGLEFVAGGGGGVDTFIALTDTPSTYTGQANKIPAVTVAEDGLSFIDAPVGFPEAPVDTLMYGRRDAAWDRAVAVDGDTMTGNLTVQGTTASDPVISLQATDWLIDNGQGGLNSYFDFKDQNGTQIWRFGTAGSSVGSIDLRALYGNMSIFASNAVSPRSINIRATGEVSLAHGGVDGANTVARTIEEGLKIEHPSNPRLQIDDLTGDGTLAINSRVDFLSAGVIGGYVGYGSASGHMGMGNELAGDIYYSTGLAASAAGTHFFRTEATTTRFAVDHDSVIVSDVPLDLPAGTAARIGYNDGGSLPNLSFYGGGDDFRTAYIQSRPTGDVALRLFEEAARSKIDMGTTDTRGDIVIQAGTGSGRILMRGNNSTSSTMVVNDGDVDVNGTFGTTDIATLDGIVCTALLDTTRTAGSEQIRIGYGANLSAQIGFYTSGTTKQTFIQAIEDTIGVMTERLRYGDANTILESDGSYTYTSTSSATLRVTTGGYIQRSTSTRASKKDIRSVRSEIDTGAVIDALEPTLFKSALESEEWKDKTFAGFVAEDVAAVFEPAAEYGREIPKDVSFDDVKNKEKEAMLAQYPVRIDNYDTRAILALAVAEIQQLRTRVTELEGGP